MSGFTAADIPDLTGQTAIVTGASSGLGLATAQALADHAARLQPVEAGQPAVHHRAAAPADRGGSAARATAAHPGYAATSLQSHSGSRLTGFAMGTLGNRLLAQDAAGGALPTLYAAFADIPGGTFAGPSRLGGLRGAPAPCGRSKAARDTGVAARLWTVSETLTGAAFPRVQPPPVQPR
jgi:hypothetical protein